MNFASIANRIAYETTLEELETAYQEDLKDWQQANQDLKILMRGGRVKNLTLENARENIRNLEIVLQHKKGKLNLMRVSSVDSIYRFMDRTETNRAARAIGAAGLSTLCTFDLNSNKITIVGGTRAEKERIGAILLNNGGFKNASLKSRRAMYWGGTDRVYRLTKMEQEKGCASCPKCKVDMVTDKFTKKEKLYICPDCGFKVPTGKTTTTRITLDVDNQSGEVDVDVTTARRSRA